MTIVENPVGRGEPAPGTKLDELIEATALSLEMTPTAELARMAAHEYDEEVVVPAPGTAGELFLRAVARGFVRWIKLEGRFPAVKEVDEVAGGLWHRDQAAAEPVSGSAVAQAFVDLGLFYSHHEAVARGADVEQLKSVLDEAASTMIFAMSDEYGPLV